MPKTQTPTPEPATEPEPVSLTETSVTEPEPEKPPAAPSATELQRELDAYKAILDHASGGAFDFDEARQYLYTNYDGDLVYRPDPGAEGQFHAPQQAQPETADANPATVPAVTEQQAQPAQPEQRPANVLKFLGQKPAPVLDPTKMDMHEYLDNVDALAAQAQAQAQAAG